MVPVSKQKNVQMEHIHHTPHCLANLVSAVWPAVQSTFVWPVHPPTICMQPNVYQHVQMGHMWPIVRVSSVRYHVWTVMDRHVFHVVKDTISLMLCVWHRVLMGTMWTWQSASPVRVAVRDASTPPSVNSVGIPTTWVQSAICVLNSVTMELTVSLWSVCTVNHHVLLA